MTTLSAWTFDDWSAGAAAARRLEGAPGSAGLVERMVLTWKPDATRPFATPSLRDPESHTPPSGWKAFWGNLVGMTLVAPFAGMAGGLAYVGFTDVALSAGLDTDLADALEHELQPDSSALLVITEGDPAEVAALVGSAPRSSAPVPDDLHLRDALSVG